MKKGKVLLGVVLLGISAVVMAADNTYTKIEPKRGQTVLIEQGPLPGTAIITSSVSYKALEGENLFNGNAGITMAKCSTLVSESVLKRDFIKNPIQKDEILGFSCTHKLN